MLRIMSFVRDFQNLSRSQRNAFIASFLGWTLDSLDFFLLIFCVKAIATDFGTKPSGVLGAVFLTQAFRPVGALVFGMLADRYGRRPILVFNILSFSIIELACAFAPSMSVLLVLRALFGIAMGGEWGVGAALAFETLPKEGRGAFSGILQEGYALGSILASAAFAVLFPLIGWRGLFMVGASPALLVLYVQTRVEESPVWLAGAENRAHRKQAPAVPGQLLKFLPTFLFLILLMTAFMSFSHGTQDVYPTFLTVQMKLSPETVGLIGVLYGLGSIAGGYAFGELSEKWGRKRAIVAAALLSIPVIPLYAYGHQRAHAGDWRGVDAVHGAGCLGCGSGVSDRAVAGAGAGYRPGIGLPARRADYFVERKGAGAGCGTMGHLSAGAGDYRGDCRADSGGAGCRGARG